MMFPMFVAVGVPDPVGSPDCVGTTAYSHESAKPPILSQENETLF